MSSRVGGGSKSVRCMTYSYELNNLTKATYVRVCVRVCVCVYMCVCMSSYMLIDKNQMVKQLLVNCYIRLACLYNLYMIDCTKKYILQSKHTVLAFDAINYINV